MKLLITNDDGVNAKGIYALAKTFEEEHEVIVIAPYEQKSASSHSITTRGPLFYGETTLEGIKSKVYWVKGTPADCVKLAVEKILKYEIDFVLSGINEGYNLGTDVLYSGTVSAAVEANIYGIPSIAVSTDFKATEKEYMKAATYAKQIFNKAIKNDLGEHTVLNINVPYLPEEMEAKDICVCRIGERRYQNVYKEEIAEDGEISYYLAGELMDAESEDTDTYYIKKGYVTVTPLHYDLTNFRLLQGVKSWF